MAARLSARRLGLWYQGLSQALEAGLNLPEALERCEGPPNRDRQRMAAALRGGAGIDEVLTAAPSWIPETDRLLWSAGAAAGRQTELLARLAEEQAEIAAQRNAILTATLYPLFVALFALTLVPVPFLVEFSEERMVTFDRAGYLPIFGLSLGSLATVGVVFHFAARHAPRLTERFLRCFPGIGAFWSARALARFAWTLDALLEAGVRAIEAVGGAALAVGDTRLAPAVLRQLDRITRGEPIGAVLGSIKNVPLDFSQRYRTAEATGQLHHSLPALAQDYAERARGRLRLVAFWYPKLLFLLVALGVGLSVARVYGQYLNFVLSLAE